MTKNELIASVVEDTGLTKAKAKEAVEAVIEGVCYGLRSDGEVKMQGLGNFKVKERAARDGRNPQTGKKMRIPKSKTVGFKVSPTLKESL